MTGYWLVTAKGAKSGSNKGSMPKELELVGGSEVDGLRKFDLMYDRTNITLSIGM